ncbi:MAG: hypothetical protein ABJN65_13025 [Parasphingorhabdus sp.]
MIGAVFFILVLAVGAVLPAMAGWSLFKNKVQSMRMFATLLGGQILVTPVIMLIAFSNDRANDEDPIRTVVIYAGMALVFSIMTFAIREMVKVQKER